MPKARPQEKKEHFMERCIPEVIRDKTAKDGSQAFAICTSMWEEHKKKQYKDRQRLKDAYKI